MAEPQNPAAAGAPQAPAQPAPEFKVPEGKTLLDATEYETLRRNNERLRGSESYFQAGSKYGIKRPEDFETYGKFKEAADKRGLKLEALTQALMAGEQDSGGDTGALDIAAIEKQLGSKYIPADKFEAELNRRDALYEHKTALKQEESIISKAIDGLMSKLGESVSARDKATLPRAFKALVNEKRNLYPHGHPLRDEQFSPHDDKSLASLVAEFEKELGLTEAAEVADIGDKANRKVTTPAGGSTSTKPSKSDPKDKPRPGTPEHRRMVEEAAKKLQAKRGGAPMSSAAG